MKIALAIGLLFASSSALAQPVHPGEPIPDPVPEPSPPPAPLAPAPSVTPPIVTISTMPVSKEVPGEWHDGPHTAAWIATGVAAATFAASLGWYFYRDHYTHVNKGTNGCVPDIEPTEDGLRDINNCFALESPETARQQHKQDIWFRTELGLGIATGATMLVAAYLWSRHYTPAHQIMITPTTNGGTVSVGGAF